MKETILVVEDDPDLSRGVRFNLEHEGYVVTTALTAAAARQAIARDSFSLVLLDLNLPDGDGLEILRTLRERGSHLPVICLTARAQETDVVMGLGLGADDYVRKPFGLAELLARVKAVLRRGGVQESEARIGEARFDRAAQRIVLRDRTEELTPIECEILDYLLRHRGQALDRKEMLADLWGLDAHYTTRTLDNHVARLRKKIELDPSSPRYIVTIHGTGYRLENETTP